MFKRLAALSLLVVLFTACSSTPPAPTVTATPPETAPQGTATPQPTPTPAPTATPLPLRVELEQRWAKGDWTGVDALLTVAKRGPEWTDDLAPKLYAANVNKATEELSAGNYRAAETWFTSALRVNPNGGEAKLGLQQVEQKQAEEARRQARANAKLELLAGGCTYAYSYMTYDGQVQNISGQAMKSVQAVVSYYAGTTFVTSDYAYLQYDPLLPGQISPFKVMTRYNPAITGCLVEFKEALGAKIPSYQEK